jgi:hypothetical protein
MKPASKHGLTGAAFGLVGGNAAFGTPGAITAERIVAHGVVGGVSSALSGGEFGTGFLSSAISKGFSSHIGSAFQGNPIGGALASAALGGATTALGGGKFANGAITSAFAYLYNQVVEGANKAFTAQTLTAEVTRIGDMVGLVEAYNNVMDSIRTMDKAQLMTHMPDGAPYAKSLDIEAARDTAQLFFNSRMLIPVQRAIILDGISIGKSAYFEIGSSALKPSWALIFNAANFAVEWHYGAPPSYSGGLLKDLR